MVHAGLIVEGACFGIIALDDVPPALDGYSVRVHLCIVVPGIECRIQGKSEFQQLVADVTGHKRRPVDRNIIVENQLVIDFSAVVLDYQDIGIDVSGIAFHLDGLCNGIVVLGDVLD